VPKASHQRPQQPTGPPRGGAVAGAQHDRDQILLRLVVEGQRGHQWEIAPGVIVPVEEGECLLPMGRIVGGVQVDGDALGPALQACPMMGHDGGRQCATGSIQRPRRHRLLKAGQRGLRGQGRPGDGIPSHGQFVQRIVGQSGCIIRVLVPTGQTEDPLAQQITQGMADFVRVSAVDQAAGQLVGQSEAVIQRLEQHDPAIRAGLGLVKPGHDGLQFVIEFKGDLRYTVCRHRVSSPRCVEAPEHRSYSTVRSLDGFFLSPVVNYPG